MSLSKIKKTILLALLVCVLLVGFSKIPLLTGFLEEKQIEHKLEKEKFDEAKIALDEEILNSNNVLVYDLAREKIIYEKNKDEKIYPASMTKIMTAIIALELLEEDTYLKIKQDYFNVLMRKGASLAGFPSGQSASLKDIVHGVLLPSGGEACLAISEKIALSEAGFSELMNAKARELGLKSTNFTNSTGLHNDSHYSTVVDIARLLKYSLKNPEFREVFTSLVYDTESGLHLESTLIKLADVDCIEGKILGGKTGYTRQAGLCLASLGVIGEREFLVVVANSPVSPAGEPLHIIDTKYILDSLYFEERK